MRILLSSFAAFLVLTGSAFAQTTEASQMSEAVTLDDLKWVARPIVVFADNENDPAFVTQMSFLESRADDLLERDVVVLTDTDPDGESALRQALRPRGFMFVLIGKDGQVKLRKPSPWDVREISRTIDKMPMRQQEMRARSAVATE
jgi:hypothetical protein